MTDGLQPMPPYALLGRIVTMNQHEDVIDAGAIYIRDGRIEAVTAAADPPPDGFQNCLKVDTSGTIYPGLIELHNHLSYNILPLWNVPRSFSDRSKWQNTAEKRQFISGPLELLNDAGGYLGAIVRYVEAKCLLGGVTTSQGLTLVNASSIPKKYRGVVRNTEEPDDPSLLKADHHIADFDGTTDLEGILRNLSNPLKGCYLLHLCEGLPASAGKHFLALRFPDQIRWAITERLAGIHAVGLLPADLQILKDKGGSIVWSPLSNLLLYKQTADIKSASDLGIRIALGSDWSPSGSKNLLGELKIAFLYSQMKGGPHGLFTDVELVRMVTSTPASILRWQEHLGSIETGKIPDLLVINGQDGLPYRKLITSTEADIHLVVIGSVPRYGTTDLMEKLGQQGEAWRIKSSRRRLNLGGTPDADVSALTLKQARTLLTTALRQMPNPPVLAAAPAIGGEFDDMPPAETWSLLLDNDGEEAHQSSALVPLTTAEVIAEMWAAAIDIHELVKPIVLDELTVAENPSKYLKAIQNQINLPPEITGGIAALYGQ